MAFPSSQLVSMSEIMRVAPWSLRALGYPFGVAERATRLVTWTEAAVGHALEMLRVGEVKLAASNRAPAAIREGDRVTGRHIDAQGRNLLEIGPPAVDLVTCDARISRVGDVVIQNAIGTLLAPAMAELAARRNLVAVIACRAGAADVGMAGWPTAGWIAAWRTSAGAKFASGDLDSLRSIADSFGGEMRTRLLKHAAVLMSSDPIVTIAATVASASGLDRLPGQVDYAARVARAYRSGIEVATDDLAHLYALERITWAPTSERSRKQAGY